MAVLSERMPVFWVVCDGCGVEADSISEAWLEDVLAVEFAMELGWTSDGFRHMCPECPPLLEVCS